MELRIWDAKSHACTQKNWNLRNETVISIKCSVYRKQSIISETMDIHQEFISIFKLIITAFDLAELPTLCTRLPINTAQLIPSWTSSVAYYSMCFQIAIPMVIQIVSGKLYLFQFTSLSKLAFNGFTIWDLKETTASESKFSEVPTLRCLHSMLFGFPSDLVSPLSHFVLLPFGQALQLYSEFR